MIARQDTHLCSGWKKEQVTSNCSTQPTKIQIQTLLGKSQNRKTTCLNFTWLGRQQIVIQMPLAQKSTYIHIIISTWCDRVSPIPFPHIALSLYNSTMVSARKRYYAVKLTEKECLLASAVKESIRKQFELSLQHIITSFVRKDMINSGRLPDWYFFKEVHHLDNLGPSDLLSKGMHRKLKEEYFSKVSQNITLCNCFPSPVPKKAWVYLLIYSQ
jgi:hypothetical protein